MHSMKQKMPVRPQRLVLALLVALGLMFGACGNDDNDDTAESNGGPVDTPPTEDDGTATPEDADPDGIIRVAYDLVQPQGQVSLSPLEPQVNAMANDPLWYLVYGRLMRQNDDGTFEPDLAESATVVDENTIEVVVREGVEFSDGTPFDAEAIKDSLERVLATRSQTEDAYQAPFFSLESVEVTAPNTVRLSIPDGTAASWFDAHIPSWHVSIMKPGQTDFSTPIGAGPMTVERHEPGDRLVVTKNENHWDADAIKVAGMEFIHVPPEPQSGMSALRAGQADITFTDASQIDVLTGNLELAARVSPGQSVGLHVCKSEGPLADARVRKAIAKGIDRSALSEVAFGGEAEPKRQIWPAGHRFHNPEVDDELAYDPDEARALLEEAGFADGFSVDLYFTPVPGFDLVTQAFQAQMAEIGITVDIQLADYVEAFLRPQPPAMGMYPGTFAGVERFNSFIGESLGNVCSYEDAELTEIRDELETISQASDEAVELWHRAAEIVVEDALGDFIVFRPILAAYDTDRLGDLRMLPSGQFIVPDPLTTYVRANS